MMKRKFIFSLILVSLTAVSSISFADNINVSDLTIENVIKMSNCGSVPKKHCRQVDYSTKKERRNCRKRYHQSCKDWKACNKDWLVRRKADSRPEFEPNSTAYCKS